MWTFIVVFVLLTAGHSAQRYDNRLRGNLFKVCPTNQVVSRIKSVYSASGNDRQWRIECKPFHPLEDCFWSDFYNLHDQEISYDCPVNHVVAGFGSVYQNDHGDRRWKFFCCSAPNLITFECQKTPMVSYRTESFDWHVPGGNFLTGIYTHNENNDGYHRWSFSYCSGTTQDTEVVNSQILAKNNRTSIRLIEGDVAVKNTRNALMCEECKWPKTGEVVQVPYVISDSFSSEDRTMITNAIASFHLSTCIRFVPREIQTDYISIVRSDGCWSYVGRIEGEQELSLGYGCVYHAIIQHELIHALSFWHEQNRSDRDDYVRINYENILEENQINFQKFETNNLDVPYEYSSVMHYGRKDFSKNGEDTITPLDPTAQIGQRDHMTDSDVLKINKLYDCQDYLPEQFTWDNELGKGFNRLCPDGQAVSRIASNHSDDRNDRLWAFSCKAFEENRVCKWSKFVNKLRKPINFRCGRNRVIAGVRSKRNNRKMDRRWRFYCCKASSFTTSNCITTPAINYWQENFSWSVPSNNFLKGVRSFYNWTTRDRRWRFIYCQQN